MLYKALLLSSVLLASGFSPAPTLRSAVAPRRAAAPRAQAVTDGEAVAVPTLREQMLAYIKSVQDRGMELTDEQKAIIAEFEEDDELLDQTGRVDVMKGYDVMSEEEYAEYEKQNPGAAQPQQGVVTPSAPPVAAAAPAAAPPAAAATDRPVDAATARMWLAQRGELEAACSLLETRANGAPLNDADARQLRQLLASLIGTVAQVA